MKTTLAMLTACFVLAGPAVSLAAGDEVTSGRSDESVLVAQSPLAAMDVDEIEGKDILDGTGSQLGDVDEIVVNNAGQPMAVVGLEGSNKEVAVPLNKLALSSDGKNVVTRLSRADLLALPDYDPMDMTSVDD